MHGKMIILMLLMGSISAFNVRAHESEVTIFLSATIEDECSVKNMMGNSANMNLDEFGGFWLVAEIEEECNGTAGYSVMISSKNGGRLVNETHPDRFIDYFVDYGGCVFGDMRNGPLICNRNDAGGFNFSPLFVEVMSHPGENISGTYTDTLILTVSSGN